MVQNVQPVSAAVGSFVGDAFEAGQAQKAAWSVGGFASFSGLSVDADAAVYTALCVDDFRAAFARTD